MISRKHSAALASLVVALAPAGLRAQENYEIQVYAAETMPRGVTMFELHSNYTLAGTALCRSGSELPTNQRCTRRSRSRTASTTGRSWVSTGSWPCRRAAGSSGSARISGRASVFPRAGDGRSASASRRSSVIRRRSSRATPGPTSCGRSSTRTSGPWYVSINPVLGKSLRGPNAAEPFVFAPNVQLGYDITKRINVAAEYYGATGPIKRLDPIADQEHMLFGALNLDFGPAWEFNSATVPR